ncbi:MAG: hypothetical protein JXX29_11775 [Deltaproteobacteria bacterium]|nr:hypothetical protein [Deltaproteobacteria bacterium]MBN2672352.1 hypothetical protein [Deltaproteobacteria bacterium]
MRTKIKKQNNNRLSFVVGAIWLLFTGCETTNDPNDAMTVSEAQQLSTQYSACEAANPPCAAAQQCYYSPIGGRPLCLPSKETACELY